MPRVRARRGTRSVSVRIAAAASSRTCSFGREQVGAHEERPHRPVTDRMCRAVGREQGQQRAGKLVVFAAPVVGKADLPRQILECRQAVGREALGAQRVAGRLVE